jgi:hypothetical protein
MPEPTDDDPITVERHATWSSIRERQRQGKSVPNSFSLDEVEVMIRSAVSEAMRANSVDPEAEIKIGGK